MKKLKFPKDLFTSFGDVIGLMIAMPLLVGTIHLFTGANDSLASGATLLGSAYALYAGLRFEMFGIRENRNKRLAFFRVLGLNVMLGVVAGILVLVGIFVIAAVVPAESTIGTIATLVSGTALGYVPYILWGHVLPAGLQEAHEEPTPGQTPHPTIGSNASPNPGEARSVVPGEARRASPSSRAAQGFDRKWVMRKLFLTTCWFHAAMIGAIIWQEALLQPLPLPDLSGLTEEQASRESLVYLFKLMRQEQNPGGAYIIASMAITLASLMAANALGMVLARAHHNARRAEDVEAVFE